MRDQYISKKPQLVQGSLIKAVLTVYNSILCTVGSYDYISGGPSGITKDKPLGGIGQNEVILCKFLYEESIKTIEKLEAKSTVQLSSVLVLVPVLVVVAAYSGAIKGLDTFWKIFVLFSLALSLLFMILSAIAAIRAHFVKGRQVLHLELVVDTEEDVIIKYDHNRYGRGLLWCASANSAIGCHIADFVKASQTFTLLSVLLFVIGIMPGIYYLVNNSTIQTIDGELRVNISGVESAKNELVTARHDIMSTLEGLLQETSALRITVEKELSIRENNLSASLLKVDLVLDELLKDVIFMKREVRRGRK